MIIEVVLVGHLEVNCYVLAAKEGLRAIIIDPGGEDRKIKKVLDRHQLKPGIVVNTHGHIDHIGCDDKFGAPVYIHTDDAALLKDAGLNMSEFLNIPFTVNSKINTLQDKDKIELDGVELEVIHVPGHTPGGIALLLKAPKDKILFSGDSLFCRSIGRTDFPGADGGLLIQGIKEKLFILPDDTVVYPGHGPSSTIGEEKRENPFLA